MKKFLAVAVIFLFIGLAVAPSINANIRKEALVEFTTEVCGLNGGKQTVKLTQEEAEEVDELFDSIRERLNATQSREDTEEIFKEAVVELDRYGLLGGLSVKQVQRLVIGGYDNPRLMKLYEKLQSRLKQPLDENENLFCLVFGEVDSDDFNFLSILQLALWATFAGSLLLFFETFSFIFILVCVFLYILAIVDMNIDFLNPFCFARLIGHFGGARANGIIATFGLNGLKAWNGTISGGANLMALRLYSFGFTGLKLQKITNMSNTPPDAYSIFLGHSLYVKIKPV